MENLQLFNNEEFGQVRAIMLDEEPWFAGRDVAVALGYSNTKDAIIKHVDDEDKKILKGRDLRPLENHFPKDVFPIEFVSADIPPRGLTMINESGVYALVFGSRLPNARKFKRWVTSDVLPTLRKTKEYKMPSKPDSYMIENPAERARRWAEEYEEKKELEQKVDELKPKAEIYDKILDSKLLVNFRDAAKEIGISQSQFTGWLKDNGYIYSTVHGELRPKENYMQSELFTMKPYTNPYNGYMGTRTYITPRGLAVFKTILDEGGHNRYTMKKHGGRNAKQKTHMEQ